MPLGKVKDVKIPIQVIIGETALSIEDLSGMREGSIVSLETLAGEPVIVEAAGKPVAKAEVVVIDEYFGFRVTELIDEKE
ncbi:MAG: FliM/FliN family flagellar motor switch protein [Spirochaetales bacterium]|jgi:flagellar motor switch protein FliN|nr:FliM/FliN family flagellar motor switch protein [Spirochaetales bacterium]